MKDRIFIVPFNYDTILTTGNKVHHSRAGMTKTIAQRCYSLSTFISKYDFIFVFLITIVSASTYVIHELRELLKNPISNFHNSNLKLSSQNKTIVLFFEGADGRSKLGNTIKYLLRFCFNVDVFKLLFLRGKRCYDFFQLRTSN